MKQKPCACFGYTILQNTTPKGYVCDVETSSTSRTMQFCTKGHIVTRNKETGNVRNQYLQGSYITDWEDELVEATAVEDTVIFCLNAELNRGFVPETTPVVIQENNTAAYDAGTRFFLCQGTLEINGVEFTGPCQIGFKNTQSLRTKTDIYGIVVK